MSAVRDPRRLLREHGWAAIGLLVLAAFALGWAGFAEPGRPVLDAAYLSLQLFVLESGLQGAGGTPIALEIARFLAPATVVITGAKTVLTIFATEVEAGRARRSRDHVVVVGLGRRGVRLVEAFRARGERVVAVDLNPSGAGVPACRARGALVLVGDARDGALLRRAGAPRARVLIAVCGDDHSNVAIATTTEALAAPGADGLAAFVHVGDEALCRALREQAMRRDGSRSAAIEFFNVFELGARAMLRRHPVHGAGAPAGDAHALVIGLGRAGEALVVAAARAWDLMEAASGARLRLTVVDGLADERMERLRARHPQLDRTCAIRTVTSDIGTAAFERARFLRDDDGRCTVSAAYVCVEEERDAIAVGLHLVRRMEARAVPVVVAVRSASESAGRFLDPDGPVRPCAGGLRVFGLIEETCTPELVLDHRTEVIARALHEQYLRHHDEAGFRGDKPHLVPWSELAEAARDDNRAQARHVAAKLAAVDCDVRVLDDWGARPVRFDEEEERLARMEHDRWMRARRAGGWRQGPRDDAARRHPDLVPWEELSADSREIDRAFVRALPQLMARAGFQVVRCRPPRATAGEGEPGAAKRPDVRSV